MVHFGREQLELSERESAVLALLLANAPRVVSRTDLLTKVWDTTADAHVVDVTIARLRKRLGPASSGIVSVPRRGYVVRP